MQVFSHSKKISANERKGTKLLIDHLKGVRDKAISHFSDRIACGNDEIEDTLNAICWLHDLGKYTSYFQRYLIEPGNADYQLKSHSNLGAHTAFSFFKDEPVNALIAFYIIKMHHSNLMNFEDVIRPDREKRMLQAKIFPKQKEALIKYEELWDYFRFDEADISLKDPRSLFNIYKKELKKELSIEHYFRVNYLFSLLIEADKLDASDTEPTKTVSINKNAVDEREGFGKPHYPDRPLIDLSQNELRNFVRAEVIKNIKRPDIIDRRIFTLAAPTGIGKTMTALDFVLKLRDKIASEKNYIPQIIYGLPFINIIEQALQEYENTLGAELVMGHYQFADVFGKDDQTNGEDAEISYNKKKMAWDTWQKDVVITSFVQLFETLIGNRNKLLKKFRHFADSIIVLDEVQTLSIEKLPVIGAALYYLAKFLNARVLIMTATQPKLFPLMCRELEIEIEGESMRPLNLLKRDHEVFACFDRTRIVPLIDMPIQDEHFITVFRKYWKEGCSCLIVVNKVNRSVAVYEKLRSFFEENQEIQLFYLSTNITHRERQERVNHIKSLLPTKTCILVSTQVVEAGVDLDFDMGFRDLGPIDSIVQVAGRINRENSSKRKGSPLYIVDFEDCKKIYGYATDFKARKALASDKEIFERDYKKMVEKYFDEISDQKMSDFEISREIFRAMKNLNYGFSKNRAKKFTTVSDFKIIEESYKGISVFIELDKSAGLARKAYQSLLNGELGKNEFDKNFKRTFNQYIVAVPTYLQNVNDLRNEENLSDDLLWVKEERIMEYYSSETGFIREKQDAEKTLSF